MRNTSYRVNVTQEGNALTVLKRAMLWRLILSRGCVDIISIAVSMSQSQSRLSPRQIRILIL